MLYAARGDWRGDSYHIQIGDLTRREALMAPEADAVIIGAGAFGLSTAFHLAALGLKRVVVVDQFAPASQTSPRAAGLFKLIQADETRTALACVSVSKVTHFAEETG